MVTPFAHGANWSLLRCGCSLEFCPAADRGCGVNRGLIGTIIGVLVVIILVIVILQLT